MMMYTFKANIHIIEHFLSAATFWPESVPHVRGPRQFHITEQRHYPETTRDVWSTSFF